MAPGGQWLPCWMGKTWILGSFYLLNQSKHILLPGCSFFLGLRQGIMESPWGYGLLHAPQIYITVLLIFTEITVFLSTLTYNLWLPGWLLLRHEYKTCAPVNGPVHTASSSPAYGSETLPLLSHLLQMCYMGKKNGVKNEVNFWFWQWNVNVCYALTANLLC